MSIKENKDFFNEKKIQSKIKHEIFEKTLESSIGIANHQNWMNSYTYVDLFAGEGLYEDLSQGSPLIAMDVLKNLVNSGNNKFDKLSLTVVEKNSESSTKLAELLKEKNSEIQIDVSLFCGEWEEYEANIKKILSANIGGFIFADPFALELNMPKFVDLLKRNSGYKDIMFLVNFMSLKRLWGYLGKDADKLRNFGINPEMIESDEDLSEEVKSSIRNFFSFKEFTIGLAIPIEKKKKLVSMDYFYLVLTTNSVGVADNFLDTYHDIISSEQSSNGLLPGYELKNDIEQYISKEKVHPLYNLVDFLYNDFVSWKKASKIAGYKVPTSKNIIDELNKLYKEEKIDIKASSDFMKTRGKGIKKSSIRSKDHMQKVIIKAC